MKKCVLSILCVCLMMFCVACDGMSISTTSSRYDEISAYVLENRDGLSAEKDIEFFEYDTTGLGIGGVYYGYYYTAHNEIVVPDFYTDNSLGKQYEADGGVYFGKLNSGTDWCFIKEITDHWYYYELHWG